MTERPILFSGPMVRALLDGSKTQTRRVMRQPDYFAEGVVTQFKCLGTDSASGRGSWHAYSGARPINAFCHSDGASVLDDALCPYGVPGDRLWVRETWSAQYDYPVDYRGNPFAWYHKTPAAWRLGSNAMRTYYRADRSMYEVVDLGEPLGIDLTRHQAHREAPRWVSPIHMPRWASRLTLTITDVRVERLQDISEEDAIAEGCHDSDGAPTQELSGTARGAYALLWDDINAKRAPWSSNPWVWALTFEVTS